MAKEKAEKESLKKADASAPAESKSTKKAKSEKKAKKDGEKKKKGGIRKWFHDLRIEFNNVTWPTKQTVVINTSVVLSVIVAGSAFIGLLDFGLIKLVEFLMGLSG